MYKRILLATGAITVLAGAVLLTTVPAQTQALLPWLSQTKPTKKKPTQRSQPRAGGGTYRTLCVRTCDGFYFPMSFKVTRSKFEADANACHQRCAGGDARLFFHRNPGQKLSSAVDLQGNRYADLENAYRYRKELVEGCGCDAPVWGHTEITRP